MKGYPSLARVWVRRHPCLERAGRRLIAGRIGRSTARLQAKRSRSEVGTLRAMPPSMANIDLPATLTSLKATAAAQVSQFPQYRGHFAAYRLVRVRCDVKTKAGLAFARGEYAIATEKKDDLPGLPSSGRFVTVWSRRNRIDTSVRVGDVEWL